MPSPRIGVVGATGAVGTVTLELLAERGFGDVRAFASARSAGAAVVYGDAELVGDELHRVLAAGEAAGDERRVVPALAEPVRKVRDVQRRPAHVEPRDNTENAYRLRHERGVPRPSGGAPRRDRRAAPSRARRARP